MLFPALEEKVRGTDRSLWLPALRTNDLIDVGTALFFFFTQIFVTFFLAVFQRAYILFAVLIDNPSEGCNAAFQLFTSLDRLYKMRW